MANTVTKTKKTIEVTNIDSDFSFDAPIWVFSAVFLPGAVGDKVEIKEVLRDTPLANGPSKTLLSSGDGEPRVQYFYEHMRLGFVFADSVLTAGAKVIFNIGG